MDNFIQPVHTLKINIDEPDEFVISKRIRYDALFSECKEVETALRGAVENSPELAGTIQPAKTAKDKYDKLVIDLANPVRDFMAEHLGDTSAVVEYAKGLTSADYRRRSQAIDPRTFLDTTEREEMNTLDEWYNKSAKGQRREELLVTCKARMVKAVKEAKAEKEASAEIS